MLACIAIDLLNELKKFTASRLSENKKLRALVFGGLFNNIKKIFTKNEIIYFKIFLVFSNSELINQFLKFLHIVGCVNRIISIKGPH